MGLGLVQVIQDRFVQTSSAYSGWLGSGTLPSAANTGEGIKKKVLQNSVWDWNPYIAVVFQWQQSIKCDVCSDGSKICRNVLFWLVLHLLVSSRCMSWSDPTWTSSWRGWGNCLSASSSLPVWPRFDFTVAAVRTGGNQIMHRQVHTYSYTPWILPKKMIKDDS